jgi:Zn-dependent oligopeptidase
MKQTFLSAFDIECHLTYVFSNLKLKAKWRQNYLLRFINSDTFWGDLQEQLWPKFMPYKMNKRDQSPCQFASIFGESFGCNYYSVIWSQVRNSFIQL